VFPLIIIDLECAMLFRRHTLHSSYGITNLSNEEKDHLVRQLDDKIAKLMERERELADQAEELEAQKEELTAAIDEVVKKNRYLEEVVTQLKERNYELDQILYRISHDLRAPLLSIKGILSLLVLEKQPDPFHTYNSHIEDRVTQMDHVLQSLASLSKSILDKPEYNTVSLIEIVSEAVARQSSPLVTVHTDLHADVIHTDRRLLSAILQELLDNAYTFRDTNKAGRIRITALQQDNILYIEMHDDGDGLSTDIIPHIFNMFYRGSERSRGAGLGLYSARKAAEQMGGTLTASSDDSGSTFVLQLPASPVASR